ncbi:MAG: flippase-like domain-containing protein [candidate division WOR-3 bacterium]|nr:MAG: flippase-like domain-containing protein [candidate division WOR-3 bacterium]
MQLLKKIVTVVVVVVIFFFLIRNLISNWQNIPFTSLYFNVISLAVSFLFLFVNFLIFVEGWRAIIRALGGTITFKNSFWIMSSSQIAKYVPGGIWFALGRVYLSKLEKLKGEIAAVSVIIETGLTFLVGIVLLFLSFGFSEQRTFANFYFAIPIFFMFLIVLYPPLLNRLLNVAMRVLKRPAITLRISYIRLLRLSFYFFGLWLAQIIGFYFLINSMYPIALSKLFNLAAAYTLSWMVGFIVIFAPAGLGVREGTMSLLLSPILPMPLAIAISFIARVWITVFEIAIFFIGLVVKRATRRG